MRNNISYLEEKIFSICSEPEFNETALEVFKFQYSNNSIYRNFSDRLGKTPETVQSITCIPFLPISFFKSHQVICEAYPTEHVFLSSGTTGTVQSKHCVANLNLYKKSFRECFAAFYGDPSDWCFLALLPSYMERQGSSLVFMMEELVKISSFPESGFYLNNLEQLLEVLQKLNQKKIQTVLIGVSFALLDLAEQYKISLENIVVMETGGMKGKRKELLREDLHNRIKKSLGLSAIHSEYGMTELLSQAYSKGDGLFESPSWMKVLIRELNDPLALLDAGKAGGINIIDLANLYSCSFIATQDVGKTKGVNCFEVLGRFDNSDMRGCNLLL